MKRIITCSDGTWNEPDEKDGKVVVKTNVAKMYDCICSQGRDNEGNPVQQLKAYDQGVGTGISRRDKFLGGITGAGLDKNILDMYMFICLSYQPGDEIYLFGFSRGAYTARSISGFIRNCGVLKPEYLHHINTAFSLYRDRNDYSNPESDLMRSFRRNYCQEDITPIYLIGVWDTVGSLGVPLPWYKTLNQKKYHFHDVTLSSTVKHAYHALSIDDRRKLFTPTLWEKSDTVSEDGNHPQQLEQRWFAGVHSNVGGGYKDSGLSNRALQWLIDKATTAGLCYHDPVSYEINPDRDKEEIRNSYTWKYWFWRKIWRDIDLDDSRQNQSIDDSVRERYNNPLKKYKPANLKKWI